MPKVTSIGSENVFKVIVVGEEGVGKTSLMYRYDQGTVLIDPKTTCGLEVIEKEVEIDGKDFTIHIWDTVGQERYRAIISPFYRYAEAVVIVYDITRKETFQSLQYWLDECEKHGLESDIPKVIIGNKCDRKNSRKVSTKDGNKFAKKHNIPFYETSSRMDSDIEDIFLTLLQKINKERSLMENRIQLYTSTDSIQVGKTVEKTHDFRHSTCCSGNNAHFNLKLK